MTLLYPGEAVSRRWEGALQARIRRAPIEVFLRSHDLRVSPPDAAQLTDHLIRTTVYIVQRSFTATETIGESEQIAAGAIACSICHELVCLISEPDSWRIAALVSAAELLTAGIGRKQAAFRAAAAARDFLVRRETQSLAPVIQQIGSRAARAVQSNHPEDLAKTGHSIRECLFKSRAASPEAARPQLPVVVAPRAISPPRSKLRLIVSAR